MAKELENLKRLIGEDGILGLDSIDDPADSEDFQNQESWGMESSQ